MMSYFISNAYVLGNCIILNSGNTVLSEEHKWTECACIYDVSTSETPCELLPVAKEVRTGLHLITMDTQC